MARRLDGRGEARPSCLSVHDKKTKPHDGLTSSDWYQDFTRFVQLKGLRQRSRHTYLGWVKQLAAHYPEASVPDLTSRQVLDFLIHLQNQRELASSTLNQALCSLRTLYRDHLGRSWKIWSKLKIKRSEPLPHVLTREEVTRLLTTFRDGRYRALFTLIYQCGLRLNEALHIRPTDINRSTLSLRIRHRHAKGGHERVVPLPAGLIERLRRFWKWHRNPDWLFPAPGRGWKGSGLSLRQALHDSRKPMSDSAAWMAFKIGKTQSGLDTQHDKLVIHTLRHSYATHMLEGGASIRQIAAYLGHRSLKPTLVYLHLTEVSEAKARAALGTLAGLHPAGNPR